MQSKQLSKKQFLLLSSLIFGLFFGAGNLIFPIHLGQLSGTNWFPSMIGFLLSAILLPLLSILAISTSESTSLYDLARPVGHWFALLFLALIHLSLGVLISSPRTATVTYSIGVQPFLPSNIGHMGLFIFSLIYFIITYVLSYRESNITDYIGKILNPIFIIIVAIIFFIAFFIEGDLRSLPFLPTQFQSGSISNGFLQGYNTMDAIAGLGFGVTIVAAFKQIGFKDKYQRSIAIAKTGAFSMGIESLIYIFLIALGASSLNYLKVSADGGTAFTQIMSHYTGLAGSALLAALTFLACITTEIGLVTSLSQDWGNRFPKLGYHFFLTIATIGSFIIANFGLDQIILYSAPLLNFVYPLAIAIILLGLMSKWIGKSKIYYKTTIIWTLIPSILDFINNLPPFFSQWGWINSIKSWGAQNIPLYQEGLDFVPFLILGLICSFIISKIHQGRK